ncbi:MAG TPA: M48 family metallopeptidase [Planctomycetota bacterium]|nr:M48 family metallopeptidase [Planctomycetota bacterium]
MTMDFFGAQDRAKRKTAWLITLFVLAVAAIIAAVYFAVALVLDFGGREGLWQPEPFLFISGATLVVVGAASLFRAFQLRTGGPAVAQLLGGRRVLPSTQDLQEKTLHNVVEEMAIASGLPLPQVFVLDEPGINAFAAGHSPDDAAIAVTRGALETLTRDQLQGVVAHEFSHVLNADMRLNLRLMAVLFGITCIATGGYLLMRSGGSARRDRKGGGAQIALLGLALYVVGSIGRLFATLIRAAVSRQREFLADAAAVQFTRNPSGIAGALRAIEKGAGSVVRSPQASEVSHMFFADALVHRFTNLFATHPPLRERIAAIEPMAARFRTELAEARERVRAARAARAAVAAPTAAAGAGPGAPAGGVLPGLPAMPGGVDVLGGVLALSPEQIVGSVGTLDGERLDATREWLDGLPPAVRLAANDPFGASALVFATLLDPRPDVREVQLAALARTADASTYAETLNLVRDGAGDLLTAARLPLIDLALPALRTMAKGQYERFRECVDALVHADAEVSTFEFALGEVLRRHLARAYEHVPARRPQFNTVLPVFGECVVVLSALARAGGDEAHAERAFAEAVALLPRAPGSPTPALCSAADCGTAALSRALDKLARLSPRAKQQLIRAAARAVACDGRAHVAEVELLRALADGIDVPVPPLALSA